jgi:FRG domain
VASEIFVKEIDNWREFYEVVAEYKNWAFRGQSDAAWPLYSALSRYIIDHGIHRQAWTIQEKRIVRIFKRKAHLFLDHVPDETDAFQWLALMQHHGAPTRLLDFTWSPFVAAFFALERATKDAAVWAIFTPAIVRAPLKFDLKKRKSVTPPELSLRNPGAYEDFFVGNEVPFVTYGEPFVMNKRLIAQSGTFVVPGVLDQPVEEVLAGYPELDRTVAKFVLKTQSLRDEAMLALYSMNITNATLFPDLDGLAKSMAYELEYNWTYNTKTYEPFPGYEDWRALPK